MNCEVNLSGRAVIYTRSKNQLETYTSPHTTECIKECSQLRLVPARIHVAYGRPGSSKCKKEFEEVLQFCLDEKNNIRALIVPSVEHITRDFDHLWAIRNKLKARGISLFGKIRSESLRVKLLSKLRRE